MMKKIIFFLVFLVMINSVFASHVFVNIDKLKEGEAKAYKTESGIYIVSLVMVSDSQNSARFEVNHEMSDTLTTGQNYEFKDGSIIIIRNVLVKSSGNDEVSYYFYGTGNDPIPVEINTDRFDIEDCNFDGECVNETKKDCCYDCGCEPRFKCEDNECMKMEGCSSDDECDDKDPCTIDSCSNSKCSYESKEGCKLEGKCVGYGAVSETDYCTESGWKTQKEAEEECENSYECLSGACKNDKCYEKSFKGFFMTTAILLIIIICFFILNKLKIIKKVKKYLFWKR